MPIDTHNVIKRITAALFTAEERRLEKIKNHLVASNKEQYRNQPHDGFTYMGKTYDPTGLVRGARTRVCLHQNLEDQMIAFLEDQEKVWSDRHAISQMLFNVLHYCDREQDIRDALPNCLVDTLDELKQYSRLREEAYTIRSNTMFVRQYLKILPRIEFYATARLMY